MRWRGCLIPCSPRPRVQSPPLPWPLCAAVPTAVQSAPLRVLSCAGALLFRGSFVFPPISLRAALSSFLARFLSSFFSGPSPPTLLVYLGLFLPDRSLFSLFLFPRFGPPSRWDPSDYIMVENCPVPVRPQSDKLNSIESTVVKASFMVHRTL